MFKAQNNPKLRSSWQTSFRLKHWDFDHWKIVSDFDIRISCFATWIVPRRFEGEVRWNKGKGL